MNNINTIFYYAESLSFSDYITMLQSGEITYRTIVFAQAQKAIYKGGVLYGATDLADLKEQLKTLLDGQEIIQKIENIVNQHFDLDPQDLPTASTTKKGCIKVGTGLSMNGDIMNVDFSNVPGGANGINGIDGIVEQIIKNQAGVRASKNNYGVVRIGDGIDVTNGIISVSLTKGDKGDKGDTGAKGDKGDTGDRGPAGPSYDDQPIRDLIANNTANLQALIDSFNNRVKSQVEGLLDDVDWMRENWPSGSGSTSNFGQSDVEAYLQMIGVWEENEAHTKLNAKWSKISQSLDNITARVSALEINSGSGGTSTGSALTAEQILQIAKIADLETAIAGLNTTYAEFATNENKELEILRWLSSALNLYSNANATWADLASAANNKSLSESGIAALQTRVTAVENGLISDARLTTLVQNKVDEVIGTSGFVSTSALQDALQPYATSASMFAAVGDVQSDVDSAIASINVSARYETEVVNGVRVPKNYGTSGSPKYRMESAASIYADQIDITAAHKLNISAADQIDISSSALNAILGDATINANSIDFTALTDASISAAKINLSGSTFFKRMTREAYGADGGLYFLDLNGNTICSIVADSASLSIHAPYSSYGVYIPEMLSVDEIDVLGGGSDGSINFKKNGSTKGSISVNNSNELKVETSVRLRVDSAAIDELSSGEFSNSNNTVTINNSGITLTNGVLSYNNSTSNVELSGANMRVIGLLHANSTLSTGRDLIVGGDVKVSSDGTHVTSGWSGTITIGSDTTLTFTKGVLTNATGTGVTAAS